MQSTLKHRNHFAQPASQDAGGSGALRRWLRAATRRWRQRRMTAALNALDDRMLRDIGLIRADIPRAVRTFDERELRMTPLAPPRADRTPACQPASA
ncbi:DUF1127 domain-containing protein [Roseovarius spongiae]|uniref:DUF1127 domain-containing protein n=1 Tax=Roseovarius spongiae TaxID=2320272 RepID=A0A3A8B5H1_9RHOB|nr:DUF1127 domain-containing protein [Roseovarius spongiae]RKF14766.1 DUF1127 domain-containing protein [Roseovarius spongiae]